MYENTIATLKAARRPKKLAAGEAASGGATDLSGAPPGIDRIQKSLLSAAERRLLDWLCAHLHRRLMPDHLTAIGFAGTILIVIGYALSDNHDSWLFVAILGFGINWFGDSLDGSLARYRKIERPQFGYFIDHSLDAAGNLLTMIGFGLSPFVRMDVALLGASAYLLLSAHTFLAARVAGTFRLSYGSVGPTELRLMLIALTVAMWILGPAGKSVAGYSIFDLLIGAAAMALLLIFARQTYVLARFLLGAEDHDISAR